jgi:hypothetical protein
MATAQPRGIDLNGAAAGCSAPWQPRLKLWEQTTGAADRKRPVRGAFCLSRSNTSASSNTCHPERLVLSSRRISQLGKTYI